METSTLIGVGVGAVVVGGLGYLYVRRKLAAQAAPSKCGAFGTLIGDIAGTVAGPADASANANAKAAAELACKLADGLGAVWSSIKGAITGGPGCLDYHRQNEQLNGPGVEYTHPDFRPGSSAFMCKDPGVLKYSNGCVPYRGAAGWEKCQPGTHAMSRWDHRQAEIGSGT